MHRGYCSATVCYFYIGVGVSFGRDKKLLLVTLFQLYMYRQHRQAI